MNGSKIMILSCGFLLNHLQIAQKKMNTDYPVIEMDTSLHEKPEKMRAALWSEMEAMDDDVETVLVAMGLCGGSISDLPLPKNIIIPKVDDCITMLMHTDENWYPNLKKCGHMYLTDDIDGKLSIPKIHNNLMEKYGEKKGMRVFDMWFKDYKSVDIVDTGHYDCHGQEYMEKAQNAADLINCQLCHVPGSNILLEKLVSGRWDHQFIKGMKGETLRKEYFNY